MCICLVNEENECQVYWCLELGHPKYLSLSKGLPLYPLQWGSETFQGPSMVWGVTVLGPSSSSCHDVWEILFAKNEWKDLVPS